jgi:hypothetical protein
MGAGRPLQQAPRCYVCFWNQASAKLVVSKVPVCENCIRLLQQLPVIEGRPEAESTSEI